METKLTTVRILKDVYKGFKKVSIDCEVSLQKIVNRTLHKYTIDENFRNELNEHNDLIITGSNF